jgi:hypothetical protein
MNHNSDATTRATVWAAEHGASSPELSGEHAEDGANAGHRFRIHGRLVDEPRPEADAPAGLDAEGLRRYLAQHTEIDLSDVAFNLGDGELRLDGTIMGEGERQQLVELLARLPGVKRVDDQLRIKIV